MDPYDEELTPRRRPWVLVVASILVLAVAGTFGFNALVDVAPDVLRPAGDRDSYSFLETDAGGRPARFDPCNPIRYVVDKRLAPDGAVEDLGQGISQIEDASGLDFRFEGLTDRPAAGSGRTEGKRWAPVVIAWVPPPEMLTPTEQAVGAAGSRSVAARGGGLVYVTGIVTFNAEARLLPGFALGDSWGDVVLHELGHLVGLGHVSDTTQVMNPNVTGGEARLGAGDLAGLSVLGSGGCLEASKR